MARPSCLNKIMDEPTATIQNLEAAAIADRDLIHTACAKDAERLGLLREMVAGVSHYACTLAPELAIFNTAVGLGLDGQPCAEQVAALTERLRELRVSCVTPVAAQQAEVGALLQAAGWRRLGAESVLQVADTNSWRIHDRPGLGVRKLVPGETRLLGRILGGCLGVRGSAEKVIEATMTRISIAPPACVYFAWLGDTPIAAGVLLHEGERAGLYFGCTTPTWRNRGAYTALVRRRVQEASSLGATTIYAHAPIGSTAERTLERNGFELAYVREVWGWRSPVLLR